MAVMWAAMILLAGPLSSQRSRINCLHCTKLLSRDHQEIIKSGHEFQPISDLVKDALSTGICQGFISGIETADHLPDCSGKGSAVCVGRYTPQ